MLAYCWQRQVPRSVAAGPRANAGLLMVLAACWFRKLLGCGGSVAAACPLGVESDPRVSGCRTLGLQGLVPMC